MVQIVGTILFFSWSRNNFQGCFSSFSPKIGGFRMFSPIQPPVPDVKFREAAALKAGSAVRSPKVQVV